MDPRIMRSPASARIDFCNTSLAKCLVFQSWTSTFRPKNYQKRSLETCITKDTFLVQDIEKTLKVGSLNLPKINKNPSAALETQSAALKPQSAALEPQSAALKPQNVALEPQSAALEPQSAAALGLQSATLEPKSAALGPQSAALKPQSAALEPRRSPRRP